MDILITKIFGIRNEDIHEELLLIERKDNNKWAMIGGMVDARSHRVWSGIRMTEDRTTNRSFSPKVGGRRIVQRTVVFHRRWEDGGSYNEP